MDEARLQTFSRFVGGRGCVVRHGRLVYQWGNISRRGDVASAVKPLYSHFLFKALETGKIASLNEKVVRWEPRLQNLNPQLEYPDRKISWRHLANQTSCYQLSEKPGSAYAYNDWQMALFWDTLFGGVYRATYDNVDETVLYPLLTEPLQCQDTPTFMAFGSRNRPGRLAISPRDFARFGLLYLHRGSWSGRQLISQKHAVMAVTSPLPNTIPRAGMTPAEMITGQRSIGSQQKPDNQTDHFGSYSWLWWVNGVDRNGTRMLPDAPTDLFGASGHGGPRAMWVIPSLDIVVSYNDATMRTWVSGKKNPTNEALRLLVAACLDSGERASLPASPVPPAHDKWAGIELTFTGPDSRGRDDPNPFDLELDVVFTDPKGETSVVPGFYDGDGRGGLDGNVWKARFSADRAGRWKYRTQCGHSKLDRVQGNFTVGGIPIDAEGFWKWGRLEAVGTAQNQDRYFKFRDGPFWLKAGCDDPENFLGSYKNYDTLAKRLSAVDYLAKRGINSLYIMTHNLGGDDRDVWPWLGDTEREAKANGGAGARFDVAKLEEWLKLFESMQAKGVVPYLVLEDDSAWKGYDHRRYYREIVARFGHLPALAFNFGEEHNENYSLPEALKLLGQFSSIDPYNHPLGIHNVNRPNNAYIDAPHVAMTSIQTGQPGSRNGLKHATEHNRLALDWLDRCRVRGRRVLMLNFDEGRPELDRRAWWSAYLAGGVWEAHVPQPYDRPLSVWEPVWTELGGTQAFMESLPFWEMQPRNDLVTGGLAFCLAKPGQVYAIYLPAGERVIITLPNNEEFILEWWNPANGKNGRFQNVTQVKGGKVRLDPPGKGDWAARIGKRTK